MSKEAARCGASTARPVRSTSWNLRPPPRAMYSWMPTLKLGPHMRPFLAGPPGFEPGLTDPESVGLPLPHGPVGDLRNGTRFAVVSPNGAGTSWDVIGAQLIRRSDVNEC